MKLCASNAKIKQTENKGALEEVLFKSEKFLVSSSKPYYKIVLSDEKTIFILGEVYAIKRKDGIYFLKISDDKDAVLRELFECNDLSEIPGLLEGDFAGVLIESGKKATIFADVYNRTEIFYTSKNGKCVVSTDLESVVKSLEEIKYSQTALSNLLTIYGYYAPKKHTIYEDVSRLGVGERLVFEQGKIKTEQAPFVPQQCRPFGAEEHEQYFKILKDAVQMRGSENCNWVFLSSGWDSTSILALLVKHYGKARVRALIGEMRYSDRAGTINQFEVDRAKKVAEYYGIQLDIVPLDLCSEDSIDHWKELRESLKKQHIYALAAYNYSRLYDYYYQNADPKDVVFSGEISDGAHNLGFSQYATILEHPDLGFREYSDKMNSYLFGPSFFSSVLNNNYQEDAVYKLLCQRAGSNVFDDEDELDETERRKKYFASFFLRNTRIPFFGLGNTNMLKRQGAQQCEQELIESYLEYPAKEATPETLYSWILHLYNSFHWQGSTVRMIGARFDEKGEKLRLPFWDSQLQNFLSEMPENWGRGLELNPTKYPLKWMLQNDIDYPLHLQTGPHSYLYDVNPQFSHSSETLFASHLSNYLKELVKDYPYEQILKGEIFNLPYIRKLVDEYREGVELEGSERNDLMSIVTLCLTGWY